MLWTAWLNQKKYFKNDQKVKIKFIEIHISKFNYKEINSMLFKTSVCHTFLHYIDLQSHFLKLYNTINKINLCFIFELSTYSIK